MTSYVFSHCLLICGLGMMVWVKVFCELGTLMLAVPSVLVPTPDARGVGWIPLLSQKPLLLLK